MAVTNPRRRASRLLQLTRGRGSRAACPRPSAAVPRAASAAPGRRCPAAPRSSSASSGRSRACPGTARHRTVRRSGAERKRQVRSGNAEGHRTGTTGTVGRGYDASARVGPGQLSEDSSASCINSSVVRSLENKVHVWPNRLCMYRPCPVTACDVVNIPATRWH